VLFNGIKLDRPKAVGRDLPLTRHRSSPLASTDFSKRMAGIEISARQTSAFKQCSPEAVPGREASTNFQIDLSACRYSISILEGRLHR